MSWRADCNYNSVKMAVTTRYTDESSAPILLNSKRDRDPLTGHHGKLSTDKNTDEKSQEDSGSISQPDFLPSPFSNSFFYLSSTGTRKNITGIVDSKINTKHESNNIYCNSLHSVSCQEEVDSNERTCDEACVAAASFTSAVHSYQERRSYVGDKTNDMPSEIEITCLYSQQSSRNPLTNTAYSTYFGRRPVQSCVRNGSKNSYVTMSNSTTVSQGPSHLRQEASMYYIPKLCSIFRVLAQGCRRMDLATLATKAPRMGRLPKHPSLSIFFTCFILLMSITTIDFAAGRRQQNRRGGGPRFPRDSGFNRGATRSVFSSRKCEAITVPLCKDIGYNKTDMSHSIMNTQMDAKEDLDRYKPVLKLNSSAELKLFLCSVYTPICMTGYREFLPPCRFICERAKRGFLDIVGKYSIRWPKNLRCEKFPVYLTKRSMCMHFNLTKTPEEVKQEEEHIKVIPSKKPTQPTQHSTKVLTTSSPTTKYTTKPSTSQTAVVAQRNATCKAECRYPMMILNRSDPLYNKVSTGNVQNCAIPCMSPYFDNSEMALAEITIKWFSTVCFVVTLLTVTTYLVDMDRFEYPQRPIIFMSVCYLFVSIGFLIRIVAGHVAVACDYKTGRILHHSTGPALCVTVFLLTYFFSMASAIWWVILSMTWFLAAGLKWGNEAIAKYFQVYHIVAWIFPSILTILVLVLSCVDGDSLSGICFVGNQDVQNLRGFVLFPYVICFAAGGLFLLVGFISLIRIRSRVRKDGKKTDKFERLIVRIGFFNLLYMLSAAILLGCYFYEQENRSSWEISHNCASESMTKSRKPSFPILMARHLMTLVIGITNGVWICSTKTLDSWKGFYRRCMCCFYNVSCLPSCGKDFSKVSTHVDQNANEGSCGKVKNCTGRLDNRYDSHHSGNSSLRREISYPAKHTETSRGSRHSSGSRNTVSRQDTCIYCSTSARTSSNRMEISEPAKKRKRKRSRRRANSENYSQASRRKRNDEGQGDEIHQVLCSSKTTSTDGSDRLAVKDEINLVNSGLAPTMLDHNSYRSRCTEPEGGRVSSANSNARPVERGESPLSDEHCDSCLNISEKYVINCDNLPPPMPHPYVMGHSCLSSSSHSQCCDHANSMASICRSDRVSDVGASLLCQDSVYRCNDDSQPCYQHFHEHHCQGNILI